MAKNDLTLEQTMKGILSLLATMREDALLQNNDEARKTEVILSEAGLPTAEIASLLGKRQKTVTQTIYRESKRAIPSEKSES